MNHWYRLFKHGELKNAKKAVFFSKPKGVTLVCNDYSSGSISVVVDLPQGLYDLYWAFASSVSFCRLSFLPLVQSRNGSSSLDQMPCRE